MARREEALPAVQGTQGADSRRAIAKRSTPSSVTHFGSVRERAPLPRSRCSKKVAETFEQSAADGTSAGETVGDDPAALAETFVRRYPASPWVAREQQRLTQAVARAADSDASTEHQHGGLQ